MFDKMRGKSLINNQIAIVLILFSRRGYRLP